jgi:hypothetical protein
MAQKRVLLPIKRFKQKEGECAVCAASSVANYYDETFSYRNVRRLLPARKRKRGLYTSQQAHLLNELGFEWLAIVISDVDTIDYSWADLNQEEIIAKLKKLRSHLRRSIGHMSPHSSYCIVQKTREESVADLIRWLESSDHDNNLVIDNDFPKYIRRSLDRGHPVIVSINATSMFKLKKGGKIDSDIKGEHEEHSVVVRGYDDKGVFIVDSDHRYLTGDLARYRSGYYKVSWERLLVNTPGCDLILVG